MTDDTTPAKVRLTDGLGAWQPIETAPKDGTNVLLVNRKGNMATGLWQGRGVMAGWWLRGGNGPNVFFNDHHGPTHWMPLPAPPQSAYRRIDRRA